MILPSSSSMAQLLKSISKYLFHSHFCQISCAGCLLYFRSYSSSYSSKMGAKLGNVCSNFRLCLLLNVNLNEINFQLKGRITSVTYKHRVFFLMSKNRNFYLCN